MPQRKVFLIATLASPFWAGCLVFSEPINVSPEVSLSPPSPIFRGEPAVFSAIATDEDQSADSLDLRWGLVQGACPEAIAEQPTEAGFGPTMTVTRGDFARFCVWVVANDRHGARAFAMAEAEASNRPPQVAIAVDAPTMAGPFAIYTSFRLRATPALPSLTAIDPDNDKVSLTWQMIGPDQVPGAVPACPGSVDGSMVCFRLDMPGSYQIWVTAADPSDAKATASAETTIVVAEDAPPCIVTTEPGIQRFPHSPADPKRFAVVRVDDDGDPFPAPADRPFDVTFTWSSRRLGEAEFSRRVGHATEQFQLPGDTYRIGDVVELRVEVDDRKRRGISSTCKPDDPQCGWTPGCWQRFTWTVEYVL